MKNFWKTNPLTKKPLKKKTTSVYKKKPNPCEKKQKTNLIEKITKTHGKNTLLWKIPNLLDKKQNLLNKTKT